MRNRWVFFSLETVTDFTLEGSKITADGDYGHEMKRHFLLGRKVMTNLDSILKSKDIRLGKVRVLVFSIVMHGCESWSIKKAECQKMDAFEVWYWRRLLIVPWTARRSNQSILKEISPEYSLADAKAETPILCVPDSKNWVIGKDPDAGKDWRWMEMGMTVDEMAGWHYRLNGH